MTTLGTLQEALVPERGSGFRLCCAYWLGRCSELIYPATAEEREADERAKQARAAEKAVRPRWWRLWRRKAWTAEFERARRAALDAVQSVARTEGERIESQARAWGLNRFRFLSGISTQCFVGASDSALVICFRGTEPNRPWDIFDDLVALPTRRPQVSGEVHLMFWTALKQVWRDADAPPLVWPSARGADAGTGLVDCLRELRDPEWPQPVWITGHSLGGALATMAAARLIGDGVLEPEEIAGVYTFGQPRVGDAAFAHDYALAGRHFRVVHDNDVVTRVPPGSLRKLVATARAVHRMFLWGDGEARGEEATGSGFEYRHVGRIAFLARGGVVHLDVGKVEMFLRRLGSRLTAPFRGGSLLERFAPGIADHSMSGYNALLLHSRLKCHGSLEESSAGRFPALSMSNPSPPPSEPPPSGSLLSLFSGAAIGLLVGLLMGLAVSPTVGVIVGGLASSLALILGLNDRYFSASKAIRIGSFGLACILGAFGGIYVRTHKLLEPSLESQLEEYVALGYDENEARDFIKLTRFGILNPDWKMAAVKRPPAAKGGEESDSGKAAGPIAPLAQAAASGLLFGAKIEGGACTLLRERDEAGIADQFHLLGDVWRRLLIGIEASVDAASAPAVLIAIRDGVCGTEDTPAPSFENCDQLAALDAESRPHAVSSSFAAAGPTWGRLAAAVERDVARADQLAVFMVLRDGLCVESANG